MFLPAETLEKVTHTYKTRLYVIESFNIKQISKISAGTMFRKFHITVLISVILAATLLMMFYRHLAISDIVTLGERNNVILAQSVLNSVKPQLLEFLRAVSDASVEDVKSRPIPRELEKVIREAMLDTTVVRVKIYNQQGMVVISTKTEQVGRDQSNNPGYVAAASGRISSKLIYRDTFNVFDQETEEDNLIQTYIPVRDSPIQPIYGVLEIYTDVNPLVAQTESTEFLVILVVFAILGTFYGFLLFVVRRSEKIIEDQQAMIKERTTTLELLSNRMLTAEERQKKRIAQALHEGVAQTLAANKLQVENACQLIDGNAQSSAALNAVVQSIQDAIQDVRHIAMEIHPSSLDEHGLLPTLDWFCREFSSICNGIKMEVQVDIEERDVPEVLKPIVYRIFEQAMNNIARYAQAKCVQLSLIKEDRRLKLSIADDGVRYHPEESLTKQSVERKIGIEAMRERTVLSGGLFSVDTNQWNGTTTQSSWVC